MAGRAININAEGEYGSHYIGFDVPATGTHWSINIMSSPRRGKAWRARFYEPRGLDPVDFNGSFEIDGVKISEVDGMRNRKLVIDDVEFHFKSVRVEYNRNTGHEYKSVIVRK